MPLRFHHAVAYTLASLAAYMAFAVFGGVDPRAVVDVVFIYTVAAAASLIVTYRNDVADRRAFLASEKISAQAAALTQANEELQRLLTTDALTGVYNRRYLDQSLKTHRRQGGRRQEPPRRGHGRCRPLQGLQRHAGASRRRRMPARGGAPDRGQRSRRHRHRDEIWRRGVCRSRPGIVAGRYRGAGRAHSRGDRSACASRIPARATRKSPSAPAHRRSIPNGVGMLETLFEAADSALYRSKNLGRNRVTRADLMATEGKVRGLSASTRSAAQPAALRREARSR